MTADPMVAKGALVGGILGVAMGALSRGGSPVGGAVLGSFIGAAAVVIYDSAKGAGAADRHAAAYRDLASQALDNTHGKDEHYEGDPLGELGLNPA